ncbi:dTDP-4-dehydrorhamnose reductase [Allosphingosinicella deserti]|uniref:dTDP-4-dehydrorhamnose reductase n=1 Tax=Allosphingosinicella deserti TaxID=2116704 RepID=A0A2P7QZ82_9SPHN|nr:dTDP-4-dehydrorhamnose reductase [Sphingomonas deserti]PSJ43256.1 dTDP-4-dehydrorhamnose reductase [Sphingomonas deserti]
MTVLILGAAGQVGRALIATAPAGAETVALGRDECDVSDETAVAAAVARYRPALIVNAAAYTAVDRAEADAEWAHLLNGMAPGWIADIARKAGSRMIHISTDFVFDGEASRPLPVSAPTSPISVYGRTKLAGEEAVTAADPDALIVRTAWVYGRHGSNFLNTMLRRMNEGGDVPVVADQTGTPTWANSLAAALWALGRTEARGIHHFTDAGSATWYDFAVAIAEEAAAVSLLRDIPRIVPISTAEYPTAARRPAFSVLDTSVTWGLIGGPPPHWRANLRACLRDDR